MTEPDYSATVPTEQPLLELLDRLNALYVSRDQIDDFAIEVDAAYPRLSRELRALTERLALLKSMNRDGVAALAEVEDLRVQLCERDALRAQLAEAHREFAERSQAEQGVCADLHARLAARETSLADAKAEVVGLRQTIKAAATDDAGKALQDYERVRIERDEAKAEIERLREAFGSHMIGRIVELDGRYHSWWCLHCCPDAAAESEAQIPHTDDCPLRVKP